VREQKGGDDDDSRSLKVIAAGKGRGPRLVGAASGAPMRRTGACPFQIGEKEGLTGGPSTIVQAAVNRYSSRFGPIQMVSKISKPFKLQLIQKGSSMAQKNLNKI
jgi:hypothetical protein